jgi:hypothetical protein
MISSYLQRHEGERRYLCRSVAARFESTVLPISTINFRIFWLVTSGSVVASLSLFWDVRLAASEL